jgi:hypothetical protein
LPQILGLTNPLRFIIKNINLKMGTLGALFTASYVYWLNSEHGFDEAIWAASKQFVYTILVGGSLVRITENVCATKFLSKMQAYALSMIIPTGITFLLLSGLHFLKGTPEPTRTIVYTTLLAPPGFLFVALVTRYRLKRDAA